MASSATDAKDILENVQRAQINRFLLLKDALHLLYRCAAEGTLARRQAAGALDAEAEVAAGLQDATLGVDRADNTSSRFIVGFFIFANEFIKPQRTAWHRHTALTHILSPRYTAVSAQHSSASKTWHITAKLRVAERTA